MRDELIKRIESALDDIRPHLAVDGGDIELIEVTDDMRVKVRWIGTCVSCNMAPMTMKAGVENAIKNKVPEIRSVEAVNGVQQIIQ